MVLIPRFIYDSDAGAEGGAGATEKQNTNEQGNNNALELPEEIKSQLAELEELRQFKAANSKAPEKTSEEIARENELEKINLKKYAVENKIASDDDFIQFDTLQQKKDADLVYEGFLSDFKEENPEITDPAELEKVAKEEFNRIYKLDSANEKAKEKGLAKLAKEAAEIRTPYKSKVEAAQSKYNEEKELRAKMPEFDKFISAQIEKNAPDKIPFKIKNGEEELFVDVELTKEDKAAISKAFNTPKTYLSFTKSPEETEKMIAKKVQGWVRENKFEEIASKFFKEGEGRGVAQGSNAGADNPFALKNNNGTGGQKRQGITLAESNDKVAQARSRYN